jgi:hypothetical protein
MDIGITRGEIDYVASNRGIDRRGVRSAGCGGMSALPRIVLQKLKIEQP